MTTRIFSLLALSVSLLCVALQRCTAAGVQRAQLMKPGGGPDLKFTHSGYLPVNPELGSEMFYMYYEAQKPLAKLDDVPIILWLQGGPGCSSL